ncbi:MAG TPA: class I SAM-dependent methyltransferase [Burkholderiaceae bacterium]|nr:class I SAM-dependent methyltransferase [Burkholderiaceae bacterium]
MSTVDSLRAFWNARYAAPEFVYGTEPNDFLRQCLDRLPRGQPVLCLADGEGRNGLWLARQGFEVTSVDVADEGLRKARALAREAGVSIRAVGADLATWNPGLECWGAIVSIFVHLPPRVRRDLHGRCVRALAPGGVFVYEGYGEQQLRYGTGGPKEPELLPQLDELLADFEGCVVEHRFTGVRAVHEGPFHHGDGHVNQFVARKPA